MIDEDLKRVRCGLLVRRISLFWVIASVVMILPVLCGAATGQNDLLSYGSGPVEIYIYTDYFCPPCQGIEPYLEDTLPKLLNAGAKITFIDKPLDPRSPLYARYFLYAAKAADNFKDVLYIRRILFEIAKNLAVASDREIIQQLKEKQIDRIFFDVKPVFDSYVLMMRKHNVRSTPTCIVARPGQETLTLIGGREIREGIDRLVKEISMSMNK